MHFREDFRGKPVIAANEMLYLYFRAVTSTACSFDLAERLGRQPEFEIDSKAIRQIAPKRVNNDHVNGEWRGSLALQGFTRGVAAGSDQNSDQKLAASFQT